MIYKNKKGFLGKVISVIVSGIFFFSTYPFWSAMLTAAADIHTGVISSAIKFISFIVLLIILVRIMSLDSGSQSQ